MPQIIPVGGLSFMIHIIINILIFVYLRVIKILKIPSRNLVYSFFKKMTDKEGESYIRTVLSHLTVMLIFCIMTLNLMLIFITLYKLPNPYTLIQQKVAEHKTVEIYSAPVIESTNPIETNNSYNFVEENIKNISLVEESLMISNDISLVDFMKSIGIEDTSFDNRAKIAEGLDVVDDKNLYQGSPKQNRDIVNKIKDEIISYLNNIQ